MYAPLLETGRLVLVPGNHDRMGHDLAVGLMDGTRVHVVHRPGLFIVRLDSTAPHNRSSIASHGVLSPADIDAVDVALDGALPDALVVLMLHHHLLPLPEDRFTEKIANFLGWPYAAELPLGRQLLERIQGKCDLVLHGHRHAASELHLRPTARRPLHVYNAGSSGVLGWVRLVSHRAGALLSASWIQTDRPELTPRLPAPARAENAVHSAGERTAASPLTDP